MFECNIFLRPGRWMAAYVGNWTAQRIPPTVTSFRRSLARLSYNQCFFSKFRVEKNVRANFRLVLPQIVNQSTENHLKIK